MTEDINPTIGQPTETTEAAAQPQRRPYVSREDRERLRKEALATLVVGEWREGKVTSVVPFGAFVDLGGIDGLVHISQLGAGGYVEKAENVVQVGLAVRVRIVEIDQERQRVGLSMRDPNAPRPQRPPSAPGAPMGGASGGFSPPAPFASEDQGTEQANGRRTPRTARERTDQFKENKQQRARRPHDEPQEDWKAVRGGEARDYYAVLDEDNDEPAPTTAEELVARFNKAKPTGA